MMWMQGTILLLFGVFIYNVISHFFTDGRGLKIAGGFPVASIVLGLIMISTAFGVNYVILYPNPWRYFIVSFSLIGLFIFQLIYFAAGFQYLGTLGKILKEGYETAMINFSEGFVTNTELNLLQWMIGCCGAENFRDWYKTTWASGRMEVPESCCINTHYCHNLEPLMVDDIHRTGCNEKITLIMKSQTITLTFMALWAFVSQLIGIVVSGGLAIKDLDKI